MERDRQLLDGTCQNINLMSSRSRSDIIECDEDLIIKLYSPLTPREMVEEEVFFTNLARSHGLRVPAITDIVEDNGRWGYAYRRIPGQTMLHWALEDEVRFDEAARTLASIHWEIHGHDEPRLPPIKSRLRPMIEGEKKVPQRVRAKALRTLKALPDGNCICHGDLHPENIIMAKNSPTILDWVDASSGHHMADVVRSYLLLDVWLPAKISEHGQAVESSRLELLCQGYRRAYFDLSDGKDDLFQRWLLPVAVARLCSHVPGEEGRLMYIIDELV